MPSTRAESRGTMETLVMIYQKQGWKQLFSGLSINYLKVRTIMSLFLFVWSILSNDSLVFKPGCTLGGNRVYCL